jgi:hypothetical protein
MAAQLDFTVVANLGILATLHVAEFNDGANVWVVSENCPFVLSKSSGQAVTADIISPLSGSPIAGAANARWIRLLIIPSFAIIGSSIYGGGEDGAAVFDGVNTFSFASLVGSAYTLTRDVFLSTGASIAAAGISLDTGGFRLFCNGTFTNNGVIMRDGKNASGATAGGSSTLGSLGIGTAGGNGRSANTGLPGTGQSNGLQDASASGGAGGAGGANAGGAGGTYTANVAGNGGGNFLFVDMTSFLPGASSGGNQGLLAIVGGGAGGGGGGSDNGGVSGGGGGGGGGVLQLTIFNLINNGQIHANGGNGAAASGAGGNGGGGGGGAGGIIFSLSRFRSGSGTIVANGGQGGAGFGTGVQGTNGNNGHINQHVA